MAWSSREPQKQTNAARRSQRHVIGVDAIREFNVHAIHTAPITANGPVDKSSSSPNPASNQWHGPCSNSSVTCPGARIFDRVLAPPFQRNQFGASLGGRSVKTGHFSSSITRASARNASDLSGLYQTPLPRFAVASVQPLLNLWPIAPAVRLIQRHRGGIQ